MADTPRVDVTLEGRPGAAEVAGILAACALAFVLLVRFDGAAAREEADRARAALAARAAAPQASRERDDAGPIPVPRALAWGAGASGPAPAGAADTASAGGPPPALLALLAGIGATMALAGSALIARTRR